MTGAVYAKKKAAPEEEVILAEAGSLTSESEGGCRGSDDGQRPTIRSRAYDALHSRHFQVLVVALVILNSLVVMVELLLELGLLESSPSDNAATRLLSFANLALLSLFVVEMGGRVVVYGRALLRHRMELLDLGVVGVTFSLAVVFAAQRRPTHPLGLLIMLRLWRVTKILGGMVDGVRHEAERRMGKERRARRALEREVAKLREYCLQQECELQVMRYLLRQNGIEEPTVLRPPSAVRTLSVIAEVAKEQETSSDSSDHSPSATPLLAPPAPEPTTPSPSPK